MANVVKLSTYGVTFATRQRAEALVAGVQQAAEIELDFSGVKTASGSFVDGLIGELSARATRVEITGLAPELEGLVMDVVERRGLRSRFRFPAAA